jgi:hypothetical protein
MARDGFVDKAWHEHALGDGFGQNGDRQIGRMSEFGIAVRG